MTNYFGVILSGPHYTLKRVDDIRQTAMREIYLENDHRAHYRVEERTKGKFLTGLTGMTASLSLNPSGSAVPLSTSTSVDITGSLITASLTAGTTGYSSSLSASVSQSFTSSFHTITIATSSAHSTGSTTSSTLIAPMPETAYNSAEYLGVFQGSDITTALSASISISLSTVNSGSFVTTSVSTSYIPSGTATTSIDTFTTISAYYFTSSFTTSVETPIPHSGRDVYELITSGSHLKVSTPLCARSVRFMG